MDAVWVSHFVGAAAISPALAMDDGGGGREKGDGEKRETPSFAAAALAVVMVLIVLAATAWLTPKALLAKMALMELVVAALGMLQVLPALFLREALPAFLMVRTALMAVMIFATVRGVSHRGELRGGHGR